MLHGLEVVPIDQPYSIPPGASLCIGISPLPLPEQRALAQAVAWERSMRPRDDLLWQAYHDSRDDEGALVQLHLISARPSTLPPGRVSDVRQDLSRESHAAAASAEHGGSQALTAFEEHSLMHLPIRNEPRHSDDITTRSLTARSDDSWDLFEASYEQECPSHIRFRVWYIHHEFHTRCHKPRIVRVAQTDVNWRAY